MPDFVCDLEPLGLGEYRGHDAYRRFYEDWVSSYDTWSLEVEVQEVAGDGMTVTGLLQTGTPRDTDQRSSSGGVSSASGRAIASVESSTSRPSRRRATERPN